MYPLYYFLLQVAKLAISVFFRRVRILHRELVPKYQKGPVVFVANHASDLMDALLVASSLPSHMIHFWAKSTLFKGVGGFILRNAGVLPVTRRLDIPGNPEYAQLKGEKVDPTKTFKISKKIDNSALFDETHKALAANGSILLFPEGTSHPVPRLRELKDGASYTVLGFMEKYNRPITIIPIGINYLGGQHWKSDAVVEFSDPIILTPQEYNTKYKADPKGTAKSLTQKLTPILRSVIIDSYETIDPHAKEIPAGLKRLPTEKSLELDLIAEQTLGAVHMAREIYCNETQSGSLIESKLHITQKILALFGESLKTNDSKIISLRDKLLLYRKKLDKLYLTDSLVSTATAKGFFSVLRSRMYSLLLSLLLLPLLIPGFLLHLPIYLLAKYVGKRTKDRESKSTAKVLVSIIFIPILTSILWIILFIHYGVMSKATLFTTLAVVIWCVHTLYLVNGYAIIQDTFSVRYLLYGLLHHTAEFTKLVTLRNLLVSEINSIRGDIHVEQ